MLVCCPRLSLQRNFLIQAKITMSNHKCNLKNKSYDYTKTSCVGLFFFVLLFHVRHRPVIKAMVSTEIAACASNTAANSPPVNPSAFSSAEKHSYPYSDNFFATFLSPDAAGFAAVRRHRSHQSMIEWLEFL